MLDAKSVEGVKPGDSGFTDNVSTLTCFSLEPGHEDYSFLAQLKVLSCAIPIVMLYMYIYFTCMHCNAVLILVNNLI